MRFSQLIAALQQGEAGLQAHHLGEDPELCGAASLEKAGADQISFLEKGSALASELSASSVGAQTKSAFWRKGVLWPPN